MLQELFFFFLEDKIDRLLIDCKWAVKEKKAFRIQASI